MDYVTQTIYYGLFITDHVVHRLESLDLFTKSPEMSVKTFSQRNLAYPKITQIEAPNSHHY